jgi:hypothetical protein
VTFSIVIDTACILFDDATKWFAAQRASVVRRNRFRRRQRRTKLSAAAEIIEIGRPNALHFRNGAPKDFGSICNDHGRN